MVDGYMVSYVCLCYLRSVFLSMSTMCSVSFEYLHTPFLFLEIIVFVCLYMKLR